MTNNDVYLTVWQVWSLVFVSTQRTLIMVKKILNFLDHWGKRAEIMGAVLLKNTPGTGSSKGVSHHNAFSHLEPDFIGIYANKVLIPHIWSRADPCYSHDELKNSQRKVQKTRTTNLQIQQWPPRNSFHLLTISDAINANKRTFNSIQRLFVNFWDTFKQ